MLVWDPIVEKYLAFGTLKTAASGETRNAEVLGVLLNGAVQSEVGTKMLRDLAVCLRLKRPLNFDKSPLTCLTPLGSQDL